MLVRPKKHCAGPYGQEPSLRPLSLVKRQHFHANTRTNVSPVIILGSNERKSLLLSIVREDSEVDSRLL